MPQLNRSAIQTQTRDARCERGRLDAEQFCRASRSGCLALGLLESGNDRFAQPVGEVGARAIL